MRISFVHVLTCECKDSVTICIKFNHVFFENKNTLSFIDVHRTGRLQKLTKYIEIG